MQSIEASANIVIAMINNKFLSTPEEAAEAYKTIYNAISNPNN